MCKGVCYDATHYMFMINFCDLQTLKFSKVSSYVQDFFEDSEDFSLFMSFTPVPGKNQLKFVTTVEPHQVIVNYPHQQKQHVGSPPQSITEGVVQLGVVQLGMVQPKTVVQPVSDGGGLQQVGGGFGGGVQLAAGFGGGGLFGCQPYGSGLQLGDRACTNLPAVCTISLNDVYLLNELQLTGYPDLSPQEKSFSYTIKVSKDKKAWLQLFNYSRVSCFGRQNLCFPTQAVRLVNTLMLLLIAHT